MSVAPAPPSDAAEPPEDPPQDPPQLTPDSAPKASAQSKRQPRRTWQAELFVDVAYVFNSNLPQNHVYRGMYTNPRTNELAVHNVGGFVRHQPSAAEPWIFEIGLHAGAAVDALTAAEPIPGGEDGKFAGSEVFKHIARANVGFALPRAKTQFAAGVFESPMGVGSFWTFHNWNYTTSWESNVVPYYLAGMKIAQPLPGNVELAGWLVNGFQTYADLNPVPSGLVTLTWAPQARPVPAPRTGDTALTLSTQVYFGPESQRLGPDDWLVYWDTWAIYDFDDHFSLAAVWDFSVDRPGRVHNLQSMYTGGALFARGTVYEGKHAELDLAVRPEASWDPDGRFFGVEQWLISATATASLRLYDHLLLRTEYRYDHSTAADGFFYQREFTSDDDQLAGQQHTVFLSLTAWWDFWFGTGRKPAREPQR
ncbi:outer membrane beta-barrel protein [Enhygromyxa salina]|uniref:outer membrane beta-barrel protein n=1 Tax=Enhygromyxa salina TaxID=215803 RepID=UPI000D092573|nr:outer membrane beta-barrel protein [Enhygromyxa salina]